jgi:hypothetical protein
MKSIKSFEEYIKEGIVKKITPDNNRSENLKAEAERKYNLLTTFIDKIGVNEDIANDYVEYCYNIIMYLIRAKMLKEGYSSSGQGAHEAEVAFSRKIGFSDMEVNLLDQLRYFRNGILYYGKRFDSEYAEKIILFLKKKYEYLKELN